MIIDLKIVELSDEEVNTCNDCLQVAFKYMVEDNITNGRWFGSNLKSECELYITNLTKDI